MSAEDRPTSSVDATLLDTRGASGTPPDTEPGAVSEAFGRYRPLAELGRGGTGRVLQALDPKLNRTVAVKALLDARVSSSNHARLLAEAQVIAQLEHPAIVPIHDIGHTAQARLYYVMKEIRGLTLRHLLTRLRQGDEALAARWERPDLLRAFVRVCEAVEYAHARGVLHRDLKPSNIVLGDFGAVYLVDWGLARVMGQASVERPEAQRDEGRERTDKLDSVETHDSHQTQHGAVLGTPGYISPEQLRLASDQLDGRSDVWSLGAILYELLTHERYVVGEQVAGLLQATLALEALDAQRLARERGLPRFLAETCAAALDPDRDARLASAGLLGERLQSYLESVRRREEDVASWIGGHLATTAAQIEARVLRIQDKLASLVLVTRIHANDPLAPATVAAWIEAKGLYYNEALERTISRRSCEAARRGDDSEAPALWYSSLRLVDPGDPAVARMVHLDRLVPLMDEARQRHGVSFVYYIDASSVLCARPCLDLDRPDSSMPVGYDNRTYTAYVVAAPPANPERSVQLTPPHLDFAEYGLIMAFSQPVYDQDDTFLGVWAMDVPLAALHRETDISAGPETTPFIVDRQGFIVVHPAFEAYIDEQAGTELRHEWGRIDPRFAELDLAALFAAGSGWLRLGDDSDDSDGAMLCYQIVESVAWLVCAVVRS